ncbi:MAG: histidine phosphatase family protein [Pseudomonadota bacterium]
MRRLILMRHAKSSWDSPTLSDHERPLNARGTQSARALGDWLRTNDFLPDEALVSDATRTQETMAGLNLTLAPKFLSALYHAGPDVMFETLKSATGQVVLIIGHNPGIAEFASALVTKTPDHLRFYDYPTGATLVADFEIASWTDLMPATGHVRAFVIPRELVD